MIEPERGSIEEQVVHHVAAALAISIAEAIINVQKMNLRGFLRGAWEGGGWRWYSTGAWDPDVQPARFGVLPSWPEEDGPVW